jgi:predicted TIM-barrel fold metal-dependent hydrolase
MTEMVAVAWRHPNVVIDVSAFRPKNLFRPGSGWEPLVEYGARALSDSIVYGTTWSLLGLTPRAAVEEAAAVGWPAEVKDRWLYSNAARFLGMDAP